MAEAAKSESMEDILQSIKRIIEDDSVPGQQSPAASEPSLASLASMQADVLELTQVIKNDGSIAALPPLSAQTAVAEPVKPVQDNAPETPIGPPIHLEDELVSDAAAHAAAAALRPLVEGTHKDYSIPRIPSSALRNGNTVEDLVLEALKPMLKTWLDEHLPLIVQKIVEKEVKRIVTFNTD